MFHHPPRFFFFFFNDTATTEIYTLSLHDALPIYRECHQERQEDHDLLIERQFQFMPSQDVETAAGFRIQRSEEHTSELQSPCNLVCRLLLEKKKKNINYTSSVHHQYIMYLF